MDKNLKQILIKSCHDGKRKLTEIELHKTKESASANLIQTTKNKRMHVLKRDQPGIEESFWPGNMENSEATE